MALTRTSLAQLTAKHGGDKILYVDENNKFVWPYVGVDDSGNQIGVVSNPLAVKLGDSASIDAFARMRVSNPETIFDSKQIFDNAPLFWDDQEVSGGSTSSTYSQDNARSRLGVALNTAGKRVRQTFMRFNYQPGKSQLIIMTGVFTSASASGVKSCIGIFDDDNGLFFCDDEGTFKAVRRTSVTGSPVDNEVAQASFNIDAMDGTGSSGVTLDLTKAQIIVIDYEWLGVGRVRMGFVIDGLIYYAHQFLNTNVLVAVYMSTPNLPLRYSIENDGTGAATTMDHICSTVISEGGSQDLGVIRNASTDNSPVTAAVVGTLYAVKGIRLKSTHLGATVKILKASIQLQSTSDDLECVLMFDPTIAGSPTWGDETNSAVQTFDGATAHTVTGGIRSDNAYTSTGSGGSMSGNLDLSLENALLLGSAIDGTAQTIVWCVKALTNVNGIVEGGITWRELV